MANSDGDGYGFCVYSLTIEVLNSVMCYVNYLWNRREKKKRQWAKFKFAAPLTEWFTTQLKFSCFVYHYGHSYDILDQTNLALCLMPYKAHWVILCSYALTITLHHTTRSTCTMEDIQGWIKPWHPAGLICCIRQVQVPLSARPDFNEWIWGCFDLQHTHLCLEMPVMPQRCTKISDSGKCQHPKLLTL